MCERRRSRHLWTLKQLEVLECESSFRQVLEQGERSL